MVGEKLPKEMHYDINIRLCRVQHDTTVACLQRVSITPVLLQKS
jgi:hypothetical protein